jgi:transcriptional regulator with XRE-family HTH domain
MPAIPGSRQTRSFAKRSTRNGSRGTPPLDSLARRAAKLGVTQQDVARHAGVSQGTVSVVFSREQRGHPISPNARTRYEHAIDAAVVEKDALASSATDIAAEWLKGEIAAGRLSPKPSDDELRRVATILRSAALVAGANGASKANGRR